MYVITGGGSGIGRALAHALVLRGQEVLVVGRREDALRETAAFSPLITICCTPIDTEEGRQQLLMALNNHEKLDGLIHNAGRVDPITPLGSIKESDWQQTMAVNLHAPLFLTQQLLSKLEKSRVLHIGTGAAHFPIASWAAYCVSKAGLAMLTRCWQLESSNTAFASVMPGIVDTDMQAVIRHSHTMEVDKLDFFKTLQKENRLLKPAAVAHFLTWLLLDIDREEFVSKEWDIYDSTYHSRWLSTPHVIPHWEN